MDFAVFGNQIAKDKAVKKAQCKSSREPNEPKTHHSNRNVQSARKVESEKPIDFSISSRNRTSKVRDFSIKTPDSSRSNKLSSRSNAKRGTGTFNLPKPDSSNDVSARRGGDMSLFLDLQISADDDVKRRQRKETNEAENDWEEISITSGKQTQDSVNSSSKVAPICKTAFESDQFNNSRYDYIKELAEHTIERGNSNNTTNNNYIRDEFIESEVKSISTYEDFSDCLDSNRTLYEEDSQLNTPVNKEASHLQPLKQINPIVLTEQQAAKCIQGWYRRHLRRHRMAKAALKRLMVDKQSQMKQKETSLEIMESVKKSVPSSRTKLLNKARQPSESSINARPKTAVTPRTSEARSTNSNNKSYQQTSVESSRTAKSVKKKQEDREIAEKEIEKLKMDNKISAINSTSNSATSTTRSRISNKNNAPITPKEIKSQNLPKSSRSNKEPTLRNNNIEPTKTVPVSDRETARTSTMTTIDDILSTIKELESVECLTDRSHVKKTKNEGWNAINSDIDRLINTEEFVPISNMKQTKLTAESLKIHNNSQNHESKSDLLVTDSHADLNHSVVSDAKMNNILKFLRSSIISEELFNSTDNFGNKESGRSNQSTKKDGGSSNNWRDKEQAKLEETAQTTVNQISSTITTLRYELEEKSRSVDMLQKALQQQRELTVRQVKETQKDMERRLNHQKEEYETALQRNHTFIDQLIAKNELLQDKCNKLVTELKEKCDGYEDKIKKMQENHAVEMKKSDAKHAAGEKIRREKWESDKTKAIKEMTIKGMETEIAQLIGNHKQEMRKLKQYYEGESMRIEETNYDKYSRQIEELRKQMFREKEDAIQKEQDVARERYELEINRQVQILEAQRKQLYQEISDERERLNLMANKQKTEVENLRKQLEFKEDKVGDALRLEHKHELEEIKRKHEVEIRELKNQYDLEKQIWMETEKKKNEAFVLKREQDIKQEMKRKRDEEIEKVIVQLEQDGTQSKEDIEQNFNNKLKRAKDKYDAEIKELETSEKETKLKYNQMRAEFLEIQGEHESLKVIMRQKEKEIDEVKQLYETLHRERGHVSDVIRQEFADRLVTTDEENRQLKREMSEIKARMNHAQQQHSEELTQIKDRHQRDMDEVHAKVKEAIKRKEENMSDLRNQFQLETEKWQDKLTSSEKRAEHLEGLLEQQRKQLLKLK